MAKLLTHLQSDDGFSLAEMVVVAALITVGSAITIPVTTRMASEAKRDSSLVMAHTFLDLARSRAVAERRNMELTFTAPNRISLVRIEVPNGDRTTIAEITLEGGQEFHKDGTLPDTRDRFATAADVTDAIYFTGPEPVMFTSDGSLIDNVGDVTNGTIFIGRPGELESSRAVTISGVTGMMRSWKWRGSSWMQ